MQVNCSWCQAILREGALPASHGICEACAKKYFGAEGGLSAKEECDED